MAHELRVPWVSEHLSFNRARAGRMEFLTGFMLPPRQTPDGVAAAAAAVSSMAAQLPVPVAVETGVNYLRVRADELPDGLFIRRVAEDSDCGLLLDLHNLWANERNGRQPLDELLAQLPLERVWEVHLAGGFEYEGYWLDAHSGPVPEPLVELAGRVLPHLPNLRALIFELTPSAFSAVGVDGVRAQLETLQGLWAARGTSPIDPPSPAAVGPLAFQAGGESISPEQWEDALGAIVVGGSPAQPLAEELLSDPGTRILRALVAELRSSTIVSTLKLTSRLLLLTLGRNSFEQLLGDYLQQVPPSLFAADEAGNFAAYLGHVELAVPYLAEVLAFEQNTIATLTDGMPRTTTFGYEPISVLRALGEGRLPAEPVAGGFEITVTGEEGERDQIASRTRGPYWPH